MTVNLPEDLTARLEMLQERGFARLPGLVDPATACTLADLYPDPDRFRSRVVMQRHAYGSGEYKYFADPLPDPVAALRRTLYPHLAPVANRWAARLSRPNADPLPTFPPDLDTWLDRCHAAGQVRPTPLLLRYGAGDYNRLHQDLYGDLWFPIQLVVMLSAPTDYTGGDFILTETRARMQSRAESLRLAQGEGLLFAVNSRPVASSRGWSRAAMRHGVSTVESGQRATLGVIFHDAR